MRTVMECPTTYEELLTFGVKLLRDYKSKTLKNNITGLEDDSMKSPYYEQLLEISRFMFTTGSTNRPSNASYQPMWIEGFVHSKCAPKLADYLEKRGVYYVIQYHLRDRKREESVAFSYVDADKADLLNRDDMPYILKDVGTMPDYLEQCPAIRAMLEEGQLVGIVMEDSVAKRRTLYEVIAEFFRQYHGCD
jgi:hypothetical protein